MRNTQISYKASKKA